MNREQLTALVKTINQYQTSELHNLFIELFSGIDSIYSAEWADFPAESFETKKGAAKQIKELIRALQGKPGIPLV